MPKYIAKRRTWLSHECREVKEGETFETTFPKVKTGKKDSEGKAEEIEMTLGENIALFKEEDEKPAKGKGKAADLV